MTQINFREAKEFIKNLSLKDSVAVIHDVDPDGMSAAVLITDYLDKMHIPYDNFPFYRGISTFKDFDLKKYDKFIILDLSNNLFYSEINLLDKKPTLQIDHHPKTENFSSLNYFKEYVTSGGTCTSRSVYELVGGKEWLMMIGVLSDAGEKYPENKDLIKNYFDKIKKEKKSYCETYVWKFGSLLIYFDKDFQKAYDIFKELKSTEEILDFEIYWGPVEQEKDELIKKFYEGHEMLSFAHFFYFEPKYNVKSIIINKISFSESKDEIFIFAIPKGKDRISISTRCQSAKYDMGILLNECLKNIPDSGSGGHKAAAGAWLPTEHLQKFKENVIKYLEK